MCTVSFIDSLHLGYVWTCRENENPFVSSLRVHGKQLKNGEAIYLCFSFDVLWLLQK